MRFYAGTDRARATCIVPATGDGYLIGGFVGNFGDADAWLLSLDADGEVIWDGTRSATRKQVVPPSSSRRIRWAISWPVARSVWAGIPMHCS